MSTFRDPIFRGCTRPATFAGVPLQPLLLVSGGFMIATGWTCYLAGAYLGMLVSMPYVPILLTMRAVTKKDDQRLHQLLKRARMRTRQVTSRRQWSVVSYSPLRYKLHEVD